VEDQEEEERRSKNARIDENQLRAPSQMILGPNLTPTRSKVLQNQTPSIKAVAELANLKT
jgi:hypothetical protein